MAERSVEPLYVQRISRIGMQMGDGELREAVLSMFSPQVRQSMGQRALFLYSNAQISRYRPHSFEEKQAELFDSDMAKRLAPIKNYQYKPARWIKARHDDRRKETFIHFNAILDTRTQHILHSAVDSGLNQSEFGRRAIEVCLRMRDSDLITSKIERRSAAVSIKQALWAGDYGVQVHDNYLRPATGQSNHFTSIKWVSRLDAQRSD